MTNNLGNKETMAKNIKRYLVEKNVSASEVAEAINVPLSTFSYWTSAKTYPRIDKIEMLANYFGIKKSDLVEERTEMSAIATRSAILVKKYQRLSERDRQIIDGMIDSMLFSPSDK